MALKQFVPHLYLEGMGFRPIGRVLGVSDVSLLKWIRAFGKRAGIYKNRKNIDMVEIDELHTYIEQKKLLDMDCC